MTFRQVAPAALAVGAALVVVACSATPSPSATPLASDESSNYADCAGAELKSPSGAAVNLTGSWRGQGGIYLVTQTGSCIAFEFLSELPAEQFGNNYRAVFTGDLRADFSVVGRRTWTFLRYCPTANCSPVQEMTLGIDFADDGSPILILRDTELPDAPGTSQTLERFSDSTQVPPPP